MKNSVIIIAGPTASGKTDLSIKLAERLGTEIINADSRQVYRFMDIGTAKPTPEEQKKIKHHFIDHVNPDEHYDSGLFGEEGRKIIKSLLEQGKTPVIAGGSGLYIKSLVDGLFEGPKQDPQIRKKLENRITKDGIESILAELKKVDPESANKLLPSNKHRIMRALEVFYLTGKPISLLQKENYIETGFEPIFFAIAWDRKILYDRINKRVLSMLNMGLIDEVKHLLDIRYSKDLKAFRTVGYKEPISYLEGKINYDEMVAQIQQYTRNYAKRQLTWFRADLRIEWLDGNRDTDQLADYIFNSSTRR